MDSLVFWKRKRDLYDEEYADDDTEVFSPRLTHTMNEVVFVRRDEFNGRAKRRMKNAGGKKQWW